MENDEKVKEYMRSKGYAQHVVESGIPGLMKNWERVVKSVSDGQEQMMEEYLNDMDGRRILEEVLTIVSNEEFEKWKTRLKKADEKIMESLVPTSKCIWGELAEIKYGYNREKDWWYFNRPNKIDYTWNVL